MTLEKVNTTKSKLICFGVIVFHFVLFDFNLKTIDIVIIGFKCLTKSMLNTKIPVVCTCCSLWKPLIIYTSYHFFLLFFKFSSLIYYFALDTLYWTNDVGKIVHSSNIYQFPAIIRNGKRTIPTHMHKLNRKYWFFLLYVRLMAR